MRHSIFGIISTLTFIPALVSMYFFFHRIGLGLRPFGLNGFFFYLLVGLSLLGIVLAVLGLIQKNRKKLFSIIGLIGNLVVLLLPLIFYLLLWLISTGHQL